MSVTRRLLLSGAAAASWPARRPAAQAAKLRIGVLNDQSGPYRDTGGPTSAACARQAAEEAAAFGIDAEVLVGDHQNKADVGAAIARQWFDRDGVDVVLDAPNSAVALAVSSIARERNKLLIVSGAGTTDLTGPQCSPNTVHWTYDTYMLSRSTGMSTVKAGGDTWFFLTANYAFGHALQRDAAVFVAQAGGKVLGNATYPFPGTTDFSSLLVSAQASGAKVLGLATAGDDTVNAIKQANEFGLTKAMRIAGLLFQLADVHALGLDTAQGLYLTESFYWDLNDRTRAFARRVAPKTPRNVPSMGHAGCYAGALHYLKTAAAMGAAAAKADGAATVARMKAMPAEDDCFGQYAIRADGRTLVPAHLFQVKAPAESKGEWDLYRLVATTPGPDAFRPLAEGNCPSPSK